MSPVVVRYLKTGREWRNAVALSWSDIRKEPPLVTMKTNAEHLEDPASSDKTVTFDWELGKAILEP